MSSLKKQQRKLLANEITARIMEYLMGLNQKNESFMRKTAEKSAGKLVKYYHDAIKKQHSVQVRSIKDGITDPVAITYEERASVIAS